jgi:ankyrin repeat protein
MFSSLISALFGDESLRLAAERFREAAKEGNLDDVQQLYNLHGSNIVKARDYNGWTALHFASWCGKLEVVKDLAEVAGADIHSRTSDGDTPLHVAPVFGQLELVKYLVEKAGANVHAANKRGETILHHAIMRGGLDIVIYLVVQCGADSHAVSKHGETILHFATSMACIYEEVGACRIQLGYGRIERLGRSFCREEAHLGTTCHDAQLEVIGYLVKVCGVDVLAVKHHGVTPLQMARNKGCMKTVACLVGLQPGV